MKKAASYLAIASLLAPISVASSAEISIRLIATPDVEAEQAAIKLESQEADIVPGDDGLFSIEMTDSSLPTALVTVSVENLPNGVAPFALQLNLPPFVSTKDGGRFVAALVPNSLNSSIVTDIVKASGELGGSISSLILLNQRARIARALHLQQPRALNADDAKLSLVFVQTSKELGLNFFIEPDDEMKDAVGLLRTILAMSPSDLNRTMPANIDRENARAAIADFERIPATQTRRLANEAAALVRSSRPAIRAQGCALTDAINEFLQGLTEEEKVSYDPSSQRTMFNLTQVLVCKFRDLNWPANSPPLDRGERISSAQIAVEQMKASLDAFGTGTADDEGLLRNARNRRSEVEARLGALLAE